VGESVDAESEVDWYIGTVPGIRLLNVGGTQFGQEDVVQSVASRVGGMLSVESWTAAALEKPALFVSLGSSRLSLRKQMPETSTLPGTQMAQARSKWRKEQS